MAEKEESKVILEREYVVPLRKGWLKAPRHKRSNKAVKTLREFLEKHMKSDDVKLGAHVNEYIWDRGIKNPPHKVKVKAVKHEDGSVKAELEGKDFKGAVLSKPKEEKPTGLKGKLQDVLGKTSRKEEAEATEEEKVEAKPEEKAEEVAKAPVKKVVPKKKPVKKATAKKTTKKSTSKKTTKAKT